MFVPELQKMIDLSIKKAEGLSPIGSAITAVTKDLEEVTGPQGPYPHHNRLVFDQLHRRFVLVASPPDVLSEDEAFKREAVRIEETIQQHLEKAQLRDAFRLIFALSDLGNKRFQAAEPWRTVKDDPRATASLLWDLLYLIRDLAVLVHPYLPGTGDRIRSFLGIEELGWHLLGSRTGIGRLNRSELLFEKLEDSRVDELRKRYSGKKSAAAGEQTEAEAENLERFRSTVDLRVARITAVEAHPSADRLYVETIDCGREERKIVSGLENGVRRTCNMAGPSPVSPRSSEWVSKNQL